jgi:hypothetical protein
MSFLQKKSDKRVDSASQRNLSGMDEAAVRKRGAAEDINNGKRFVKSVSDLASYICLNRCA